MRCDQCGTTNEAKARFCIECGNRLGSGCPSCGSENPPAAKFCAECGASLAAPTSRSAAPPADDRQVSKAERRLVTVLFADLVGFTPFSEERDAEDVRETLDRYFDLSREVIERYGGTVEKFIGDAVMAVWGTPVAREDDAERAVRAAVELIDAVAGMDGEMQARAGVQTGEAAVTLGAVGQGMVAGDLVNTTARIQSVADPGTVLVDEATMRSSSKGVAFESAGERELKGKSGSVPLWRALRLVAEVGGRGRSDGLEAPFVGRDTEFRLLKELFHASSREERVRLISVVGQGGIGKSRLAWELEKYIDGLVEPVWYHHGRSPAYGSGITFWALGEMVRGRCGLVEGDGDEVTRRRVAETVARFVPDEAEREWIGSALLTLLGIGSSAVPGDQMFPAWRSFFEHIARQGTTLLVFEDLQWADGGLLDFIDHLMDWSRELPLCIIALTRPELMERQPDWGSGVASTSISLGPLDRASMEQLLEGLVPGLPVATRDQIVSRADGVPLYAIETVRMLLSDGRLALDDGAYRPTTDLTGLETPESLRALVASRLDALEREDRRLMQAGAVIGHTFPIDGLAAVVGSPADRLEPRLRGLVRREMLVLEADPRSPERGQYAFAQELLREVAYETLAREDRKAYHLAVAGYFESLDAEVLSSALAAQYVAAHRNARPGGEADALAVQARRSLEAAGERAMSLGSTAQAQQLLEAALEMADEPTEQTRLLVEAAKAGVMAGHADVARGQLEQAIELYLELGDRDAAALATAQLVDAVQKDGWQLEKARNLARDAAADFEDLGESEGLARILAQLARLEMLLQEDLAAAIAISDRTLAMAEPLDLPFVVADVLVTRGTALASSGRPLEGIGTIEAGRKVAQDIGDAYTEARALLNLGGPLSDFDLGEMFDVSRKALEIARRIGERWGTALSVNNLAMAATATGQWDLAIEELRRELAANDDEHHQARIAVVLALLLAHRGEDEAELTDSVVRYFDSQIEAGTVTVQREADSFLAQLALAHGRYDDSIRHATAVAIDDSFNATGGYFIASLAALLARDVSAVKAALDGLATTRAHGPIVKLDRQRAQAGIDALSGHTAEALAGFTDVMRGYRQRNAPFYVAATGVTMCAVLDPSLPEVKAAEAEAREILEGLRARAWLDRLDEVLVRSTTVAPVS